ncbi:hypothetical protein DN745_03470 [Bradymonas sediminis]|uniref:Uncharacterized protein n=1 Tax=Bradymonas sediminis TaxID=1548548 RepID=A0A2Z4FI29_9DELT|nr:hypothetical protein DN745_03470 [Bradymonas sediminis]
MSVGAWASLNPPSTRSVISNRRSFAGFGAWALATDAIICAASTTNPIRIILDTLLIVRLSIYNSMK